MSETERPLKGKVAIVIGCSRIDGIGRAAAQAMSRMGADLMVTGTNNDPDRFPEHEKEAGWRGLDSVVEELTTSETRAMSKIVDVTKRSDVADLLDETVQAYGRVDIVVNNWAYGGSGDRVDFIDVPEDVWRGIVDVNVHGLFHSLQVFGRHLVDQGEGGRIINVSTSMSKLQLARTGPYASTKSMMNVLTHVMAKELGPNNINVNAVCPGPIPTGRAKRFAQGKGSSQLDRYGHMIPLGRLGTVEDIAAMIAYLAGPSGDYITGQTVNIDGGWAME